MRYHERLIAVFPPLLSTFQAVLRYVQQGTRPPGGPALTTVKRIPMTRSSSRLSFFARRSALLVAVVVASACLAAPAVSQTASKGPKVAADYGVPQVKAINEQIARVWKDNQLSPSPQASDGEWCRRVFLDILGRIPSV